MEYTSIHHARRHNEYSKRLEYWQFLQDSYDGGFEFKKNDYLVRYVTESDAEYRKRIENTPIDNHCRSIISIYNSFIFKNPPIREFKTRDVMVENFLNDADKEGRTLNDFMSQVNIVASIFGHAWVIVDKPEASATTRAQEINNDLRPYTTLFTPLQVLDWDYKQYANGSYYLAFLRIFEYGDEDSYILKNWYPDRIEKETIERNEVVKKEILPNPLGIIPAVCIYSQRSYIRGIGISDIGDIADVQRSIFDANSEIEQIVRLSNHPSLVVTRNVEASAGAGSLIVIPEDLESGIKPYMLQPSAASIDGVRGIIKDRVETINRMANVGGVRQTETKKVSGIALQQEFELLNARLGEKAKNLELGEEQIWYLYSLWTDMARDFVEIFYPTSFNTRDKVNDFTLLSQALPLTTNTPTLYKEIYLQMAELFVDDAEKLTQIVNEISEIEVEDEDEDYDDESEEQHARTTPENRQAHIQEMIMDGYDDDEILEIHPEITAEDILSAKRALLDIE